MIDLDPSIAHELKRILQTYVPECRVFVFGSRVQGKAQRYSDIDLLLQGDYPLSESTLAKLRFALSDSNIPINVDVVDMNSLSVQFIQNIQRNKEQFL
ncbi:MAG: nucleotidyltransferase domain-containing protein [Puniceicoccales bacterium]|jgi:predicted nucleotidyltransferase|nr:nucleotidyltransferase domain-containing protein [Puniceicoccales bacterium]